MGEITVVGISGASNSGKTTLVDYFSRTSSIKTVILRQDDFFKLEDSTNCLKCGKRFVSSKLCFDEQSKESKFHNWDTLETHDMDGFRSRIQTVLDKSKSNPILLLIEGFTIFDDNYIQNICHHKIFLEVDKKTSETRRAQRNYYPADPEGYFENCVWTNYLMYRSRVMQNVMDIHCIDSTLCLKDLEKKINSILS